MAFLFYSCLEIAFPDYSEWDYNTGNKKEAASYEGGKSQPATGM
jgi:hypothetical protein